MLLDIFPSQNGTVCKDDDDDDLDGLDDGLDDDNEFELKYCDLLSIVNSPNSNETTALIQRIKSGHYGSDSEDGKDGDDKSDGSDGTDKDGENGNDNEKVNG